MNFGLIIVALLMEGQWSVANADCPRLAVLTDIGGDIADWMRKEFSGTHYILATKPPGRDKREGTYRGMYLTGDESLTSRAWIDANVRSKGALGKLYPVQTCTEPNPHGCLKEGDKPSWFFFLPTGGNDSSDPTKPGCGAGSKSSLMAGTGICRLVKALTRASLSASGVWISSRTLQHGCRGVLRCSHFGPACHIRF